MTLVCCGLLHAGPNAASVRVVSGPTPIPRGNAQARADITIVNDKLAFALAVESPVPYGVPRGAIIDLAPVSDGKIGRDRVVFADFIPDNWSAWPSTYQRVKVIEQTPKVVRVLSERDFGKASISTTYSLREGSDRIEIMTTMTNRGTEPLQNLLSGLTLWPSSGFLFAVPGLMGLKDGSAAAALARRVTAYDRDWSITLHAPYLEHVGSSSRDLFMEHSLAPGASRSFQGWLQVGTRGDLVPVMKAQIEQSAAGFGTVHGTLSARSGAALSDGLVIVERDGKPYAWALAQPEGYRIDLPSGDYTVYATGRGFSRSAAARISVAAGSTRVQSFTDMEGPGTVEFTVFDAANRARLDARIAIRSGERPVVEFLGRTTFFTELDRKGHATLTLAPGDYTFSVSAGAGVLGADAQTSLTVRTAQTAAVAVPIVRHFNPAARGWYAADLHHHADQAEAVTPPADLVRSQLAAGLDLLFVSDHDTTVNHPALRTLAHKRNVPFIAGIELSPSWGHFNAYPLDVGATLQVDTGTAQVDAIFKEARREGAAVIQVNHPFIPYGYLSSVLKGVAPGGFNDGFDLMEINSANRGDDGKVLAKLWEFWNSGERHYLTAGSDTHDVWNEQSGLVRMYAHVDGPPSVEGFARSLKDGHGYATYGPLIFPSVMFGSQIKANARAPVTLGFDVGSIAGVSRVELVVHGKVVDSRAFKESPLDAHVNFTLHPAESGWCALLVEDSARRKAYSDPIWITVPSTSAVPQNQ